MNKSLAYFFSLILMVCAAQFVAAQMKSDPSGAWGGALATDAGPGGLEITLARDGVQWKGTMKVDLRTALSGCLLFTDC